MATHSNRFNPRLHTPLMFLLMMMHLMWSAAGVFGQCATLTETVQIPAPATSPGDLQQYGWAVALDGEVAIIGAVEDFLGGSGAAYVYRYDSASGIWNHEQDITPADGFGGDQFGYSLAISEVGGIAVIGSPFDDDSGDASGSAYVFRFNGTTWVQEAKLTASDGMSSLSPEFGFSVSINDTGNLIAIGAHKDDSNGGDAGSAYIFRFIATSWVQDATKITAAVPGAGDRFGESISLATSGGTTLAVIGAPFSNPAGAAYVIDVTTPDTPIELAKLFDDDPTIAGDKFGSSVSISGDAILIEAPDHDLAGNNTGAAYIYRDSGTGWGFESKITSTPNQSIGSRFGEAVSLDGNIALVSQVSSERAYVFNYDSAMQTWPLGLKFRANVTTSSLTFGRSLAISGDSAIIGEWGYDPNGFFNGLSYTFTSLGDCNLNGLPDACDPPSPDRNQNGISDCLDIAADSLLDCNDNGVIDIFEVNDYWNPVAPFIDHRFNSGIHSAAASLIDGKIYVSHGIRHDPVPSSGPPEKKALSIYDIASDSWTHGGPNAPDAFTPRRDLGGATANGRHYAIGGVEPPAAGGGEVLLGNVAEFTPGTNTWLSKTPMPTARAGIGCASWNNLIYVVGGRTGTIFGEGTILNTLERFNPAQNTWVTTLPDMPLPVSECSATIAYNGKIYVFGGATSPTTVSGVVQVFDTLTSIWTFSGDPNNLDPPVMMPTARGGAMVGMFAGKMVVFGGKSSSQSLSSVEFYDPDQNVWTTGSNLVEASYNMAQGVTWDESGIYSIGKWVINPLILPRNTEKIVQKLLPAKLDCNANGIPDSCDQVNNDCNNNGVPDECDPDCNQNGTPDECDIANGLALDCNFNGIPDRCEVKQCRADISPPCTVQPATPDVNIDDLVAVLNAFGPCLGCPEDFMPDFDPDAVPVPLAAGDGVVDISELVDVLNNFGSCTTNGNGATAITLAQMDFSSGFMLADGSIDVVSSVLVSASWAANQTGATPVDVYRLYAQVPGPTGSLAFCGGGTTSGVGGASEPLVLNAGKGATFFVPGGSYAPVNVSLLAYDGGPGFEYFQSQAFGTFIAMGSATGSGPMKLGNISALDGILTGLVNDANTGWGVTGSVSSEYILPDGNGGWQILIGQFAVPQGETFTAAVRLVGDGVDTYATISSLVSVP